MVVVVVASLSWFGWSIGGALTAPGSDSVAARLAEWGRRHHLGHVITSLERAKYEASKPRVGGTVPGGIPTVGGGLPANGAGAPPTQHHLSASPAPAPLAPISTSGLHGEGQWQDLYRVHGQVAARVAFLRPDAQHTSYLADVVWMDPRLVRFSLFPGIRYQGQPYTGPSALTTSQQKNVLATFNSGFQLKDSHGGYFQAGKTVQQLLPGSASMVFGKDGSLKIEPWPGGKPGPSVAAVRQNLTMMVTNGVESSLVNHPHKNTWGVTLGDRAYVWRTGIGVRRDGTIVFVLGPALNIRSLATLLEHAGAVNAMELDINPAWTNYFRYAHPGGGSVVPYRLGTDNQPSLYRYLQPCSRDFVGVFPR